MRRLDPPRSRVSARGLVAACWVLGLAALATAQEAAELAPQDLELFERRIRPLFVERCIECHSAGASRAPKGGLSLERRAGWERGGDSGPAVVPGDVEASLLVRAVRYADPDLLMPPDGRLAPDEVLALEEWVRRGAPDPRGGEPAPPDGEPGSPGGASIDLEQARAFWALRPLVRPEPPDVRAGERALDPLDRFVLERLEREGLELAPPADRRAWLRRVTFDLVGLPPTPEEVASFLADGGADARERVVDRLLASPAYGERFARMWLDVARYADSNGLDENLAFATAWRYRDWVVAAFNKDLPYDRFLLEQIAGDLLPAEDDAERFARWTATGFLCLGPKMLAEQDKEKLVMDVVDEQLDVLARATLGLTVGCARCHDHKFDPIPQSDYYALAGILKSTSTLSDLDHVSRWRERELATPDELAAREAWEARRAQLASARAALEGEASSRAAEARRAELARYLLAGHAAARAALFVEAEDFSRGNLHPDFERWGSSECGIVHTTTGGEQFVEYDLAFARAGWLELQVRYASAEERPMRVSLDGARVAERALGASTGDFHVPGQRWETVARLAVRPGRNVLRLERASSVPHLDKLLLVPVDGPEAESAWPLGSAPAEGLESVSTAGLQPDSTAGLEPDAVRSWADFLVRSERSRDPLFAPWHALAALFEREPDGSGGAELERRAAERLAALRTERAGALGPIADELTRGLAPRSLRELAGRYQTALALADRAAALAPPPEGASDPASVEARRARFVLADPSGPFGASADPARWPGELRERLAALERELAEHDARRPPPFAAVLAVADGAPVDVPIHVRGSHLNLGPEPVPRGALSVLEHLLPPLAIPPGASGRLELARWIVDPRNPLTPRVAANRVWATLMGRGLAAQPSYFGRRAEPPSHPELLDWLAAELVDGGWSIKRLARRICLSATYGASSSASAAALERDPTNLLWSHRDRRRLSAEALRDALLSVSGSLDRTLGGSLLGTADRGYVTNDQSNNQARYGAPRRALYLPIVRNAMYPFYAAFDYADPSVPIDQRPTTTVASQGLFLMNSPLWIEESERFARSLLSDGRGVEGDPERVDEAWLRALGRRPGEDERTRVLAFLARRPAGEPGPAADAAPLTSAAHAPAEDASPARLAAWRAVCQALCASNEFLYLD